MRQIIGKEKTSMRNRMYQDVRKAVLLTLAIFLILPCVISTVFAENSSAAAVENMVFNVTETSEAEEQSTAGWKKGSGGRWWYDNGDGTYPYGEFKDINGKTYYFGTDGYMVTGWQSIKGNWYFFENSGAMMKGWQKINGTWYYLDNNGVMQTGWLLDNGNWYYLENSGRMATGWINVNNKWYYMNGSGAMQTGWQKIGGTWYYMNGNGAMQTGWQFINGSWYYFDGSGAMQTGWQWINGSWYYMYSDGKMATNTWIDGYYVDSNGRLKDTSIPAGAFPSMSDAYAYGNAELDADDMAWARGELDNPRNGFYVDGYRTSSGVWYYIVTFYY